MDLKGSNSGTQATGNVDNVPNTSRYKKVDVGIRYKPISGQF